MNAKVKHSVMTKFAPEAPAETKAGIFAAQQALPRAALGILKVVHGPLAVSLSGPDLSQGDTDELTVTFRSADDRNRYHTDQTHLAILQDKNVPHLIGGAAGPLRFDFIEEE